MATTRNQNYQVAICNLRSVVLMLTNFGHNPIDDLGGGFKSVSHALFTKSKRDDFLLGEANKCQSKVVWVV